MRFKQGKGDPAGFKEFMRQENIRPDMIVCYVGNRFHVMFHLAAVFFHLKEKLLIKIFRQYLSLLNRFSFSTTEGPEK